MKRQIRDEYNAAAQECSEYEPIQAAKSLAMNIEEHEIEDAGCDSCIHYNNGECGVYKVGGSANFNDSDY